MKHYVHLCADQKVLPQLKLKFATAFTHNCDIKWYCQTSGIFAHSVLFDFNGIVGDFNRSFVCTTKLEFCVHLRKFNFECEIAIFEILFAFNRFNITNITRVQHKLIYGFGECWMALRISM